MEAIRIIIILAQRHDLASSHVTEQAFSQRHKVRTTRSLALAELCSIVFRKGAHNEPPVLDRRSAGAALALSLAGVLGNVVAVLPAAKAVAAVGCWVLLVLFGEPGEVDLDGVWDCAAVLVESDPGAERFA
jgi:hypothetical protein